MNLQIIGTRKCSETRKAQRFFSERGIRFAFVDLTERPLSRGELANIARAVGEERMVDTEGRRYAERNMRYMVFDTLEELERDPLLLKTPVVRNGREATVGPAEAEWKRWIDRDRPC